MHRRLQDRFAFFPLVMLCMLGVVACTPYATYPPMNEVEPLLPGLYPVPQVMGKSLQTAYDKTSGNVLEGEEVPPLVYAIPAGISDGNWKQVGNIIDVQGARALTEDDYQSGMPFWSVEQVRIRNHRAEVDVVFPTPDGFERATVILESDPFTAFEVKFFQRWRVPVEKPAFTHPSNKAPEAPEGQEDETPAQQAGLEAEAVVAPEPQAPSNGS
ncbi:MAG: hypothetical protein CMJ67_09390 [Planctomycetaceae bacterium]|nr:hypothetical protein [Planctomycetaceae bacterium]